MAINVNMIASPQLYARVITHLVDRLVQEEVWSQTVWPENEPVLTEQIVASLGEADLTFALTLARDQAGVGKLGWES